MKHCNSAVGLVFLFAGATTSLLAQHTRRVLNNVTILNPAVDVSSDNQGTGSASPTILDRVEVRCWARIPYPPSRRDLLELAGLPSGDRTPLSYAQSNCLLGMGAEIHERLDSPRHSCVARHVPAVAMNSCFRISK